LRIIFQYVNILMVVLTDYIFISFTTLAIAIIVVTALFIFIDNKISNVSINIPMCEGIFNKEKKDNEEKEMFDSLGSNIDNNSQVDQSVMKFINPEKVIRKMNPRLTVKGSNDFDQDVMFDNVEGIFPPYAISGCRDRHKKWKLYPNVVECNLPNYLTAENYYATNFEYPYVPGQDEQYYLPANFGKTAYLAPANISYRVIARTTKKNNKPPFAANLWFDTVTKTSK